MGHPNSSTKARLALVLAAVAAAPAALAGELIDATDPARVSAIAQQQGESALTTDGMGEPLIEAKLDGQAYRVYFYDCKKSRDCRTLMFQASWEAEDLSDADMAEWNREERFGKAFVDDEGSAVVEMNVNLHGGVSPANLEDTFDWWRVVLKRFRKRYRL